MPDFQACADSFVGNETAISLYGWDGPVFQLPRNRSSQISLQGCLNLCGKGAQYYDWTTASGTILNWILPVLGGVLLQAPFESNAFIATVLAFARWLGSPIASLSYSLWNIRISGHSALMVDMAVPYKQFPGQDTDFAEIRDSFYLLTLMNQFTMKAQESMKREAEGLLRIVLFSNDLRLRSEGRTLKGMRRDIAQELRENRRGGAVPAFIGQLWFMFAMACSIQQAFWAVGNNATAHNLSLGLILSWMPVLILCSIVDQPPGNADGTMRKFNQLIDEVRFALQDAKIRADFISGFQGQPRAQRMGRWVQKIAVQSVFMDQFFVKFAGQGRVRWHYGCTHAILADIERSYIGQRGRSWLDDEGDARLHLVLGTVDVDGMVWFDLRELWQVLFALTIFCTNVLGSFMLSFFTPTVGLGCHTGGYLIFASVSIFLLLMEAFVWWICAPIKDICEKPHSRMVRRLRVVGTQIADFIERQIVAVIFFLLRLRYKDEKLLAAKWRAADFLRHYRQLSAWVWWERLFFRPIELVNCAWLVYICAAQTIGAYETCECMTSSWSSMGGYMDFNYYNQAAGPAVIKWWIAGTVVGCTSMSFGLFYVIQEWCKQSFMATSDYNNAMSGLRTRRLYMRMTFPFRQMSRTATILVRLCRKSLCGVFGRKIPVRTPELVWTKDHASVAERFAEAVSETSSDEEMIREIPRHEPLSLDMTEEKGRIDSIDADSPSKPETITTLSP